MTVPSSMYDLDTTAANNSPSGSETIGTSLDDYLRAIQAVIKQGASQGANIASSSTITPPASGSYFSVTGTSTITTIASTNSWNGRQIVLVFAGALTFTHNASTLILPGGANITTAAGDAAHMVQEGSGIWRCAGYERADGNIAFTGTGKRITGDFSNGTNANRVLFQTSTANNITYVGAIPSAAGQPSGFLAYNNPNPDSASYTAILTDNAQSYLFSGHNGASYLPLLVNTGGSTRLRVETNGDVGVGGTPATKHHVYAAANSGYRITSTDGTSFVGLLYNTGNNQLTVGTYTNHPVSIFVNNGGRFVFDTSGNAILTNATGALGYGAGSGGTVTQATSKETAVTLNKPSGQITMHNASLGNNSVASFVLNNTVIAATDLLVVNIVQGSVGDVEDYHAWALPGSGTAIICLRNISGGTRSEAVVLNYAVIRGATA